MSRLSTWCRDRLIYYTSIKQRERNEFRQIIVERPGIKESDQRLSACLRNTPSCCQIHVSPGAYASFAAQRYYIILNWQTFRAEFLFVVLYVVFRVALLGCVTFFGFLCNKIAGMQFLYYIDVL